MANTSSDDVNAPTPAPVQETAGTRLAAKRAAKAARKASERGTQDAATAAVAESVLNVTTWLDQHGTKLLGAVVAVCVAVAGWLAWSSHASGVASEAGDLLQSAIATSNGLVVGEDDTAPEDVLVPTFSSADAREKKALEEYRAVLAKFPQTPAGHWAKLGEANTLLRLGKHAEATAAFDAVLSVAGDDLFLRARALEGGAYALEAAKNVDGAIKKLQELSALNAGAYKPVAEYQRARMLAATGRRDEARKVLEAQAKAEAEKPADATAQPEGFAATNDAAQTLLQELGGQPVAKPGLDLSSLGAGGGISQEVIDALRRQLEAQSKEQPAPGGAE